MAFTPNTPFDNLTRMVQTIGSDEKLRSWFSALQQKSTIARRNDIYAMLDRLRADGLDADLVSAFRLLADSRVFEAACVALEEHDR